MMTIEDMNAIREKLGLTYQELCRKSGVPVGTIQKVLSGTTKNPRIETMRKLEDTLTELNRGYVLRRENAAESDLQTDNISSNCGSGKSLERTDGELPGALKERSSPSGQDLLYTSRMKKENEDMTLRETPAAYGYAAEDGTGDEKKHLFTAAEREALSGDRRTELIDGVLYEMTSPLMPHQDICKAICSQIDDCIRTHHSNCHSFMAPADVCLDCDEYTVVQPDVFVVCDRSQITKKNIQGAPAFILEVLSPATRKKDKVLKLWKYMNAGVHEYWMIDPDRKQVIIFDMTSKKNDVEKSNEEDPYQIKIYGFSDKIPMAVSEDKCVIDMNPVREMLEDLYGF